MKLVTIILGYGLLIFGGFGLILPLLQGIIFLFLGLVLLSVHVEWAKKLTDWLKGRHDLLDNLFSFGQGIVQKAETGLSNTIGSGKSNQQ